MIKKVDECCLHYLGAAYFGTDGRLSRAVYWKLLLINLAALVIVWMVLALAIQVGTLATDRFGLSSLVAFALGATLFGLPCLVIFALVSAGGFAQWIRRFHDFGFSGWWLLLLLPVLGILRSMSESGLEFAGWLEIALLLLPGLIPGVSEDNKFGSYAADAAPTISVQPCIISLRSRVSKIIPNEPPSVAVGPAQSSKKEAQENLISEAELNKIYAVVAKEVADRKFEEGLLSRARVQCGEDKDRVELAYIELRVRQYQSAIKERRGHGAMEILQKRRDGGV